MITAGLNGVAASLGVGGINTSVTTVPFISAGGSYKSPPNPGAGQHYYLVILDFAERFTKWEKVKVTAVSGSNLTVVRNVDSVDGFAQSFSEGAWIQWVPGGEEAKPRAKFVMSAGGWDTSPWRLDPILSTPQYTLPDSLYSGISHATDAYLRWYNNTGATLRLSQLLAFSNDNDLAGDVTLTVQVDGSSTAIAVTILGADVEPILKRDQTNTADLPDGSYLSILATNTAASETAGKRLYLHRLSLLLEEI